MQLGQIVFLMGRLVVFRPDIYDMKSSLYFQPKTDGYIAIVLPKLKNYEAEMKKLHSKDVYLEKIKNR